MFSVPTFVKQRIPLIVYARFTGMAMVVVPAHAVEVATKNPGWVTLERIFVLPPTAAPRVPESEKATLSDCDDVATLAKVAGVPLVDDQ